MTATATSPEPAPAPAGAPRTGRRRSWRRRLLWALLALVAVLVSLVVGLTTANAAGSLGPHTARYAVTTDSTVTVDLGPLGTLQIDSPLPLTLGIRVTVQEIPEAVTVVDAASTLQALSGDLQTYVQFFTSPQATVHDVAWALAGDAARRAGGMLVLLLALWFGGRWLMGAARRAELSARAAAHRQQIVGAVAVVVVASVAFTSSTSDRVPTGGQAQTSTVFNGTALEGARVTGRLGGVINTYGSMVVGAIRQNDEFYADADAAMVAAWDDRQTQMAADAEAAAQAEADADAAEAPGDAGGTGSTDADGTEPGADGTSTDGTGADGTSTDEPSDEPSPTSTPDDEDAEPITLLLFSDMHCNVGMARLVTSLAKLSDADVVLDGGDTTMNGTSVEQYCVTTFARAVPSGVPLVTSPGNHDSSETSQMYAKAGATVLSGEVVTVDGIRILGDHDPNETRIGVGTTSTAGEDAQTMGERLSKVACDDSDGVDILLIHTPRVGTVPLDDGCVPVQLSGHLHRRIEPVQVGEGIRYVNASSAGAAPDAPTLGPLHGTAELTVLRFDPTTRQMLDWQLVQVFPDGTAQVGDRVAWPMPETETEPAPGTDEDSEPGTVPEDEQSPGAGDLDTPSDPTQVDGQGSPTPAALPAPGARTAAQ